MVGKLSYYVQKSMRIGLRNVIKISYNRARFAYGNIYWRYYALHSKKANNIFVTGYSNCTFSIFFSRSQSRSLSYIKLFYDPVISKEQFIEKAQLYTNNEFYFLGSYRQQYDKIPWHTDFRLQQQSNVVDAIFDKKSFYRDLHITQEGEDMVGKDIKVPWELSRFQYLYILGKAYECTKQQCYVDAFQRYVTDWLDNNTYLCGINWMCPMEVGIRAINWLVAQEFFKNAPGISLDFWERLTHSLYDHMCYLENNWEYYDSRTNNHYLSNLVAYFYLCWFFDDLPGIKKKRTWVVREILSEFEKQIFPEGTSYEGSTTYHCFVTELFYHAYLLFQEMDVQFPEYFKHTLALMFDFISSCAIYSTSIVSIGDNDSGKLLYYGLTQNSIEQMKTSLVDTSGDSRVIRYFPHFGLSIAKMDMWHITLRHHVYNTLQPSGHFHNDFGSITLAVNGLPVIVDPGSFVYTPSVTWRNYFRSVNVHNTSFISGIEPVPLSDELFVLHLSERFIAEDPTISTDFVLLQTRHDLYAHVGLQFIRQLELRDDRIYINDRWININEDQRLIGNWNFTLAVGINVYKHSNGWLLAHGETPLIILNSPNLVFSVDKIWVSNEYGRKEATQCLRASRILDNEKVIIEFIKA